MSAVEIEEVRDLDAVWPDVARLFAELHEFHVPFGEPPLRAGWQGMLRSQLAGFDRILLLARHEGKAVGLMNARLQRSAGLYDDQFGFIENAYLAPEQRGTGVAQTLLDSVEAWCRSRGVGVLRLSVNAHNALAMRFWEKSGFQPMLLTLTKEIGEVSR